MEKQPRAEGSRITGYADFMRAVTEVTKHPLWEWKLRCEPRVAYNAASDSEYFIFKLDNNGTTFLVGQNLPALGELI